MEIPIRTLKVSIAQINTTVGDFVGNVEKMAVAISQALDDDADVLVFPEMCIPGYTAYDLFQDQQFLVGAFLAQDGFIKYTKNYPELYILFGAVTKVPELELQKRHSEGHDCPPLFNSALLVKGGEVIQQTDKKYLPNKSVFTDKRWFATGAGLLPAVEIKGLRVGTMICEDTWRDGYAKFAGDYDVILSPNASPFEEGKIDQRFEVIQNLQAELAADGRVPVIVYCNQVGANDEIVFDGNSFVYYSSQHIEAMSGFEEDFKTFAVTATATVTVAIFCQFEHVSLKNISNWTKCTNASSIKVAPITCGNLRFISTVDDSAHSLSCNFKLIRKSHQDVSTNAGLQIFVSYTCGFSKSFRECRPTILVHLVNWDCFSFNSEVVCERLCIFNALRARKLRGHQDTVDILCP